MASTPTPNIRLTISVTPEVHQTFQRLSKASGMSIGRAMGEWLGDTIEAAEFMTTKVEQARAAPAIVMREMHAYALGLVDETSGMIDKIRDKGRADRASGQPVAGPTRGRTSPTPPSSNTGGKGTDKQATRRGRTS